ncbi:MAG: NAD(P)H-dependent oxidoreductase [Leeuwenhoekiella sp.]
MDIIESLQWRYATKKFDTARSLTAEQINVLTQSFNLTATSYGLQPIKLLVIQDTNLKKKLLAASMHQQQVVDASHLLVICIERTVNAPFVHDYFDNVKSTRNTPEKILAPFRETLAQKFDNQIKEENYEWATRQAYLALGNLLTICAIEKIDSCPMEGFVPEEYDAILGLKSLDLKSVLALPVGYRAKDDMFANFEKVRRPIEETVIYK